jgi:hypothetical protein
MRLKKEVYVYLVVIQSRYSIACSLPSFHESTPLQRRASVALEHLLQGSYSGEEFLECPREKGECGH